jgi:hypothetical protein
MNGQNNELGVFNTYCNHLPSIRHFVISIVPVGEEGKDKDKERKKETSEEYMI